MLLLLSDCRHILVVGMSVICTDSGFYIWYILTNIKLDDSFSSLSRHYYASFPKNKCITVHSPSQMSNFQTELFAQSHVGLRLNQTFLSNNTQKSLNMHTLYKRTITPWRDQSNILPWKPLTTMSNGTYWLFPEQPLNMMNTIYGHLMY